MMWHRTESFSAEKKSSKFEDEHVKALTIFSRKFRKQFIVSIFSWNKKRFLLFSYTTDAILFITELINFTNFAKNDIVDYSSNFSSLVLTNE